MSTVIVFLLTLGQLVAIAIGYYMPLPELFDALAVYGSPPYFIMHLLSPESVAFDHHPLFPLIALFHIVKYLFLCRSQFVEDWHSLHYLAIILEGAYLVIAGANL